MVWRVLNALLSRRLWPTFITTNFSTMQKRKINRPSGSKSGPKVMSEVLNEYLESNEPLAKGYRKFLASKEKSAGKGDEQ